MAWLHKRDRAVAVVIHADKLLVIGRLKRGRRYFSLPGGGIEAGETGAEAAAREVFEETTIKVTPGKLLYEHEYNGHGTHYYYLCEYVSGQPKLGSGDERFRHIRGINEFNPQWLQVNRLSTEDVVPADAVELIIKDVKNGFSIAKTKTTYNRGRR